MRASPRIDRPGYVSWVCVLTPVPRARLRNQCIQQSFLHYNWSAITTVVTFTETNLSDLCAVARAHGAKVVVAKGKSLNTSRLGNSSYTGWWVRNITAELALLRDAGVYGLNLDVEHFRTAPSDARARLRELVCSLQRSLGAESLSMHSVDTQARPLAPPRTRHPRLPARHPHAVGC